MYVLYVECSPPRVRPVFPKCASDLCQSREQTSHRQLSCCHMEAVSSGRWLELPDGWNHLLHDSRYLLRATLPTQTPKKCPLWPWYGAYRRLLPAESTVRVFAVSTYGWWDSLVTPGPIVYKQCPCDPCTVCVCRGSYLSVSLAAAHAHVNRPAASGGVTSWPIKFSPA